MNLVPGLPKEFSRETYAPEIESIIMNLQALLKEPEPMPNQLDINSPCISIHGEVQRNVYIREIGMIIMDLQKLVAKVEDDPNDGDNPSNPKDFQRRNYKGEIETINNLKQLMLKVTNDKPKGINDLPNEVLDKILGYVDLEEQLTLRLVNSLWCQIASGWVSKKAIVTVTDETDLALFNYCQANSTDGLLFRRFRIQQGTGPILPSRLSQLLRNLPPDAEIFISHLVLSPLNLSHIEALLELPVPKLSEISLSIAVTMPRDEGSTGAFHDAISKWISVHAETLRKLSLNRVVDLGGIDESTFDLGILPALEELCLQRELNFKSEFSSNQFPKLKQLDVRSAQNPFSLFSECVLPTVQELLLSGIVGLDWHKVFPMLEVLSASWSSPNWTSLDGLVDIVAKFPHLRDLTFSCYFYSTAVATAPAHGQEIGLECLRIIGCSILDVELLTEWSSEGKLKRLKELHLPYVNFPAASITELRTYHDRVVGGSAWEGEDDDIEDYNPPTSETEEESSDLESWIDTPDETSSDSEGD